MTAPTSIIERYHTRLLDYGCVPVFTRESWLLSRWEKVFFSSEKAQTWSQTLPTLASLQTMCCYPEDVPSSFLWALLLLSLGQRGR